jgi:hypothetical protein
MYGSQFHSQLALTTVRPQTAELKMWKSGKNKSPSPLMALLVLIALTFSCASSHAGPSQPKLPGKNGNVIGR